MACDDVSDFTSFLAFVNQLAAERGVAEAEEKTASAFDALRGWQNSTISGFLEAAAACARDHYPAGSTPPEPIWRLFAWLLQVGKVYE